jgi:hypothetical protein
VSDLVERLRSRIASVDAALLVEAADEIDRLHVVQAMEQYWHRQYDLTREHIRKIQAAVMALPSDQRGTE